MDVKVSFNYILSTSNVLVNIPVIDLQRGLSINSNTSDGMILNII